MPLANSLFKHKTINTIFQYWKNKKRGRVDAWTRPRVNFWRVTHLHNIDTGRKYTTFLEQTSNMLKINWLVYQFKTSKSAT